MKYFYLLLIALLTGCSNLKEMTSDQEPFTTEPIICPTPSAKTIAEINISKPPHFQPSSFKSLPGWNKGLTKESWSAFLRECSRIENQVTWQLVCRQAELLGDKINTEEQKKFFEAFFRVWRIENGDGSNIGLITGYYEPVLRGQLERSDKYPYPVYGEPRDLLTIELGDVLPELKGKKLKGRLIGQKVVPYLSRADIDLEDQPINAPILAWVRDPIDLFFMQIQGSGQLILPNGDRLHLGYADQNGHPYRSIGKYLIDQGELPFSKASALGIKEWLKAHPDELHHLLNQNPSYVFFRILPNELHNPLGALGVPLTPETSLAIDPHVVPLGSPIFMDTSLPNKTQSLRKLMLAQDVGGAIRGAVRADFYWGTGDQAGKMAGTMRQAGRMWLLYPKEFDPPQPH